MIKKHINDRLWWYYKRKHRKHNPNWPKVSEHPFRILIIGGSASRETNASRNLETRYWKNIFV